MSDQLLRAYLDRQAEEFANSTREVMEIVGGDAMAAVRMLVVANIFLHEENERLRAQISSGFTRGQVRKPIAIKR